MAHFAKVENGIVQQVIVVNNEDLNDLDFPESEPLGQQFIASIGLAGDWVETSYNNNFRDIFAGIGYAWDGTNFITPKLEVAE
jgi:hypothetical protein